MRSPSRCPAKSYNALHVVRDTEGGEGRGGLGAEAGIGGAENPFLVPPFIIGGCGAAGVRVGIGVRTGAIVCFGGGVAFGVALGIPPIGIIIPPPTGPPDFFPALRSGPLLSFVTAFFSFFPL